jgi:hypothetical protein
LQKIYCFPRQLEEEREKSIYREEGSLGTMSWQFLYVVASNSKKSTYTLHRFNPSPLFYPKGAGGPDRAAAAVEACYSFPPPTMSFHPIQFKRTRAKMEFMLFGRDRNKIVCTDDTSGKQGFCGGW